VLTSKIFFFGNGQGKCYVGKLSSNALLPHWDMLNILQA